MDQIGLPLAERRVLFDAHLRELCLISVADAGLGEDDVDRYIADATSDGEVREAVKDYAYDYDLTIVQGGWVL